ncbi:biliverdin-producing heme oxygenase [Andreprevotia sp. IGB-42]|uniref:biliverdin-producing heme oxygenase n=1 Tax=Andreprevotia sp. IGB-42 TaxID=2497473 RepID=UPI00191F08B8|nr:biliverdin-producing heme oxygenase [Andreprevotia sp. IGB-42]
MSLRSATAALHAELDDLLSSDAFAGVAQYRRFLAAQAAALVPLEAALEAAGIDTLLPDWPARCRRFVLQADLAQLGEVPGAPDAPPQIAADASRWGYAYVLEGSRLGARLLSRQLEASGNPALQAAGSFLQHGSGQPFWQTFLTGLEQVDEADAPLVHAGAQHAFALFIAAARHSQAVQGQTA